MKPLEKRKFPRRSCSVPAIIYRKGQTTSGQVLNISEEGLALEVKKTLDMDEKITIEFLPPLSAELVSVQGVVRHVSSVTQSSRKKGRENFFWVGVWMIQPSLTLQQTIRRFIKSPLVEAL